MQDRCTVEPSQHRERRGPVVPPDPGRAFFNRFPTPVRIQREVVPFDVRNQWFFVVGSIPSERFRSVELRDDDGEFSTLSPSDLESLAECVEAERQRSLRVVNGDDYFAAIVWEAAADELEGLSKRLRRLVRAAK